MRKRVIIVEDHAPIRRLVRHVLGAFDVDIYEYPDADSAWKELSEVRPDVALLDVMMEGAIDGLGLCHRIRMEPEFRKMHVIMLTARGQHTDVSAGELAGANEYIVKPFSPSKLHALLVQRLPLAAGVAASTTG